MNEPLYESSLHSLALRSRGKVRDIYEIDAAHLLIVTTDRLSAFDVVLPTPIPGKGAVLTELSRFWMARVADLVANHLVPMAPGEVFPEAAAIEDRAVVVRKLQPLPLEAIVRGYLIGSGWKDYRCHGRVGGLKLPAGLRLAEALPEPIFTPSTKAPIGEHDVNVDFARAAELVGERLAEQVREVSLAIYRRAAAYALERGLIIADTKLEFALDAAGALVLIDEVLTPDSSRFWPAATWMPGVNPPSFDKQFVRDYLETLDWNKRAPGPELPAEIVTQTAEKYREARRRLIEAG